MGFSMKREGLKTYCSGLRLNVKQLSSFAFPLYSYYNHRILQPVGAIGLFHDGDSS